MTVARLRRRPALRRVRAWRRVLLLSSLIALPLACGDAATPASAPVGPPLQPAQVRAVVDAYVRAFATRDRALYVALFADDGTVEDPVGSPVVRGHDALAAFFDAATKGGPLTLELAPDGVRIAGSHVAFAFTLHLDAGAQALVLPVIDTFDLDPDGRIRAMRAYWNPADFRPLS
jgi:steroid delta-isomerase